MTTEKTRRMRFTKRSKNNYGRMEDASKRMAVISSLTLIAIIGCLSFLFSSFKKQAVPDYGSMYKGAKGLKPWLPDKYGDFQPERHHHHKLDDCRKNAPARDGIASSLLPVTKQDGPAQQAAITEVHGAMIRGDQTRKKIALVFTGDGFADGGHFIVKALKQNHIHGSFFLTGNFYRNKHFKPIIGEIRSNGNYLGTHSDKHLLYCDWVKRDSLLVTHQQFTTDIQHAYAELQRNQVSKRQAHYFLPPYEWYNDSIACWTRQAGLQLVNFTPGTRSNADYTYPEMGNGYVDSRTIYNSILNYEQTAVNGLNGFILLIHIGTDPRRTDKFYFYLPRLIRALKAKGYAFLKINELLEKHN